MVVWPAVLPVIPILVPSYICATGLVMFGAFVALVDEINECRKPNYYDADKNTTSQVVFRVVYGLQKSGVSVKNATQMSAAYGTLDKYFVVGLENIDVQLTEGLILRQYWQCKLKVSFFLRKGQTGVTPVHHLDCVGDCVVSKVEDCKERTKKDGKAVLIEAQSMAEKVFDEKYRPKLSKAIQQAVYYMGKNGHIFEPNKLHTVENWERLPKIPHKNKPKNAVQQHELPLALPA